MPSLSVIVPVYNNIDTIERCLKAIRGSKYRDYELIVVDDGSNDGSPAVAEKYADKVVTIAENKGRNYARKAGMEAAAAGIIVNIDSDVVVYPDTLAKVADYLSRHPEIDALTGLLSKEHPNAGFFSQYKNLYMHYIFKKLPDRVNFLYGSMYAIRAGVLQGSEGFLSFELAEDTALGQWLAASGRAIGLLREAEVIHLKKYSLPSLLKNNFQIAYNWALIFLLYRGWKQLGTNGSTFAHTSKEQVLSLFISWAIFVLMPAAIVMRKMFILPAALLVIWFSLNYSFLYFLRREKGIVFSLFAAFAIFLDNISWGFGVLCRYFSFLTGKDRLCP